MIHKTYSYRQMQRQKHIDRKKSILRSYRLDNLPHRYDADTLYPDRQDGCGRNHSEGWTDLYWYYQHEGQFDKGKIHCSCPMCRFSGYTIQDRKMAEKMQDKLEDVPEGTDIHALSDELEKEINNNVRFY